MALIVELGGGFGDLNGFARIGQFNGFGRAVQHHAIGCFCFSDCIFSEVQRLAFRHTVFIGDYSINNHILGVAQSAIRRNNILGGGDFIGCPCEVFIRKHKAVYAIRFHSGEENLAAFGNADDAFLRHIELLDRNNGFLAVHLECDGSRVENISVSRTLLDDLIIAVRQFFGHHELARDIGIIGVNVRRRRVVDMLHDIFARVGVAHLETDARRRNDFTCFGVLFNDFNDCLIGRVVDEKTVYLSVLADEDGKRRKKLFAVPALNLPYGIFAVGQVFGFSKTVFVAYKDIPFGFLGVFVAACRFQIHFKLGAFFGCFDFGSAVIAVLNYGDFSLDDIFKRVEGLCKVVFHGIQLGFRTDVQAFGID